MVASAGFIFIGYYGTFTCNLTEQPERDMTEPPNSKNKLGLWTSTSLVVGNMVGSGVFLLPAALASFGGISLVGWIVSSIGALMLARIFSKLSVLLPNADGGPYAYTRKAFGDFAGFLIAWGYWISVWTTNATIAISLVGALSTFFPLLATHALVAAITGLGFIWLLTWVNTLGIRASGEVQLVTTILKLIPLVAIGITGLFFIHLNYFTPFNRSGGPVFPAIISTATLTLFAFLGIECATIPAESVARPEKTIPKATMIGTILTTVIYIFTTISIMGIIPAKNLQNSVTPFADAAALIWGDHARYWIGAGVAIAAFGALNGWILVQGQMPFAIAKDRLFPPVFEKQNKKGVPATGLILSSILASVFMLMNYTRGLVEQFKFMILVTTTAVLVPYLFVTASFVVIKMEKGKFGRKEWVRTLFLAGAAFLFSLFAIVGSGQEAVFWGFILLLSGIPFYVWVLRKKNKSAVQ
jgi:basic amino acid/polyamine antiporter, APA family